MKAPEFCIENRRVPKLNLEKLRFCANTEDVNETSFGEDKENIGNI